MPSKKKKYNARFPAGRIKKIMQTDEEVGKVAQAVPIIISRTLELFVASLLTKTLRVTNARNAKTISPSHMKQCIMSESRFDFLRELVKNIPDISVNEDGGLECTSPGPSNDNSITSASSSPSTSRTFHNIPANGNNNVIKYNGKNTTTATTTTSIITPSSAPIITTNETFPFDINKQIEMKMNQNYDRPTTSSIIYEQQQQHPLALNFYKEIPEIASSVIQHTSNTYNTTTTTTTSSLSFDEGIYNDAKYAKKLKRFDSAPSSYNNDKIQTIRPLIKIDEIQKKPNTPVINLNTTTIRTETTQPLYNIDLSKNSDYYQSCNLTAIPAKEPSDITINSPTLTRSLLKTNIIKRKAAVPKLAPIVKIDLSNSFQQTSTPSTSSPSISSSSTLSTIDLSNKPINYSLPASELIPPIININVCNDTPIVKIDYSNLTNPTLSSSLTSINNYNNNHHINDFLPSSSSSSSSSSQFSCINSSAATPIINIDLSNITNTSNNLNNNNHNSIKNLLPSIKNATTATTTIKNSTLDMDEDYDNI